MEITLQEIVFYVVAAAIAVFSVLAVTTGKNFTRRYLPAFRPFWYRSYLRCIGIYLLRGCTVNGICRRYCCIICILYLADSVGQEYEISDKPWQAYQCIADNAYRCRTGIIFNLYKCFALNIIPQGVELPAREIGLALIGTEKYQFVLPFEVVSILLLACMIGAILIARKQK